MTNNPEWMEAPLGNGDRVEVVVDSHLKPDTLEPMVSRSVRLSVDLYQWLREEAQARELNSWSELLRVLAENARRPATEPVVPVRELEAWIAQHSSAA